MQHDNRTIQFLKLVGLEKPELEHESFETVAKLIAKQQTFQIPVSYINKSSWALKEFDYLTGLQRIAIENETTLFHPYLLTDHKDELETYEVLAASGKEYRRLAKAILRKNIALAKKENHSYSEYAKEKLSNTFRSIDEVVDVFSLNEKWIREEDEPEQFPKALERTVDVLGQDESITELAQAVYDLGAELRHKDIKRDNFFEYIGHLTHSFSNAEEFASMSKRFITLMEEEDIKDAEKKNMRFRLPYYVVFKTLGKLRLLTANQERTEATFRLLARTGRDIVCKDGMDWYRSRDNEQKFSKICSIIQSVGNRLSTLQSLEELLDILKRIEMNEKVNHDMKRRLEYIDQAFPYSSEENRFKKEENVLEYARLIEEDVERGSFNTAFFRHAIHDYADLAKDVSELRKVADVMFGLRQCLTKAYGDYRFGKVCYYILPEFRKVIHSLDELENNSKDLYRVIRYCGRNFFETWADKFPDSIKPIVGVSKDFPDLKKNLYSIRRQIKQTDNLYPTYDFFYEVMPYITADSIRSLKRRISTTQGYMRRWSEEGINIHSLLSDGIVSAKSLLEENPLEDILEMLDRCAAKAKEQDVVNEAFKIFHNVAGWYGHNSHIQECEVYENIFNDIIDIAKGVKESNINISNMRIGHTEDLETHEFFSGIKEYKEIVQAGFIPVSEFMEIYKKMPEGRRETFLEDVKSVKEEIKKEKRFRPSDFLERFVMYNIAASKSVHMASFNRFTRICENYLEGGFKGRDWSDNHEEAAIVEKYGIREDDS